METEIQYSYIGLLHRGRINHIKELEQEDGSLATNKKKMVEIAKKHFSNLFISEGMGEVMGGLRGVGKCITEAINRKLTTEYKIEEVLPTLKEMAP